MAHIKLYFFRTGIPFFRNHYLPKQINKLNIINSNFEYCISYSQSFSLFQSFRLPESGNNKLRQVSFSH